MTWKNDLPILELLETSAAKIYTLDLRTTTSLRHAKKMTKIIPDIRIVPLLLCFTTHLNLVIYLTLLHVKFPLFGISPAWHFPCLTLPCLAFPLLDTSPNYTSILLDTSLLDTPCLTLALKSPHMSKSLTAVLHCISPSLPSIISPCIGKFIKL